MEAERGGFLVFDAVGGDLTTLTTGTSSGRRGKWPSAGNSLSDTAKPRRVAPLLLPSSTRFAARKGQRLVMSPLAGPVIGYDRLAVAYAARACGAGFAASAAKDGSGAKDSLWRRSIGTPSSSSTPSTEAMKPSGPQ